jgi:eukaryotic-like serine/threonine-protein kinase
MIMAEQRILQQRQHFIVNNIRCVVVKFIAAGGQGEVYKADWKGKPVALKWYYPHYLEADPRLQERLHTTIKIGPPGPRFMWPQALASIQGMPGFGYVMELREPRFQEMHKLMNGSVDTTLRAMVTAAFELAHNYQLLHAEGLCYRDISFGNAFFDPQTGEIRICDNDNVDTNGVPGIVLGTPRFIAPELFREVATPNRQTDLFALSVLLFCILMRHHPLEGQKDLILNYLDAPVIEVMKILHRWMPVFIFDPNDDTNRLIHGVPAHDLARKLWRIYPRFIRKLFRTAFTDGLQEPDKRISDLEWRDAMLRLRDSLFLCQHCRRENFYDSEILAERGGYPPRCRSEKCNRHLVLPHRMRIGRKIIMLPLGAELFAYHTELAPPAERRFDLTQPTGVVVPHPHNSQALGLKNVSPGNWVVTRRDSSLLNVEPGRSIRLEEGIRINFGTLEGEVR